MRHDRQKPHTKTYGCKKRKAACAALLTPILSEKSLLVYTGESGMAVRHGRFQPEGRSRQDHHGAESRRGPAATRFHADAAGGPRSAGAPGSMATAMGPPRRTTAFSRFYQDNRPLPSWNRMARHRPPDPGPCRVHQGRFGVWQGADHPQSPQCRDSTISAPTARNACGDRLLPFPRRALPECNLRRRPAAGADILGLPRRCAARCRWNAPCRHSNRCSSVALNDATC
jgi:hypothetical protein